MRFYDLTHPPYATDHDQDAANPIRMQEDAWLPGVVCPACGETWAGSRRIYLEVPNTPIRRRLGGAPLPLDEWRELEGAFRSAANVPDDFRLEPGDILGAPRAEILASEVPDLLHPFSGQVVVRPAVVEALQRAGVTGFRPLRVDARWAGGVAGLSTSPPALYELLVTGTAWRSGMDLVRITACRHCGRTVFPDPARLVVDEAR
jgi:hypothetical protein